MPNNTIRVHARIKTFEYDEQYLQESLLDFDPIVSTDAACKTALRILVEHREINPEQIDEKLISSLNKRFLKISKNFWRDENYDARTTDAEIKRDIKDLVAPLQAVLLNINSHNEFVRQIIGSELAKHLPNSDQDAKIAYQELADYINALLKGVKSITDKKIQT